VHGPAVGIELEALAVDVDLLLLVVGEGGRCGEWEKRRGVEKRGERSDLFFFFF